jgi:hypothetical protein
MTTTLTLAIAVLGAFLGGCSITAERGSSSGSSTSTSPDVPPGSETVQDTPTSAGTGGAANGKTCSRAEDCGYYYCKCADGAVVNSRACVQGSCQLPSAHCSSACAAFRHGAWSGVAGGGDGVGPSGTSTTGGTSGRGGQCTSKSQCSSYGCGCTDGARINVRECYNGTCTDPETGCQAACQDSGRGDWDGT